MKSDENPILKKSFDFALLIIEINKFLTTHENEYVLSKQLLRSGTSIGANAEEAQEAESNADFIHKFSISNKECSETLYWLRLLMVSGYLNDFKKSDEALSRCRELKRMLVSIIKGAKRK